MNPRDSLLRFQLGQLFYIDEKACLVNGVFEKMYKAGMPGEVGDKALVRA